MKIDYVIGAVVGMAASYFWAVMLLMASNGRPFGYWCIAFLLIAHICSFAFVEKRKNRENVNWNVVVLVSPSFVLLIGLFIYSRIAFIFS